MDLLPVYPQQGPERDSWIVGHRPERNPVDPWKPYAFLVEDERSHTGELVPVATILLTNRECPWRCAMCDLWRNTLSETVPRGAIPAQIRHALSQLPVAKQVKLYNSGSFFDLRAIPPDDYGEIASAVSTFERVVVESHPSLVGERGLRFRDMLAGQLEVAMGLETVEPIALERLNKRLTLKQFSAAAEWLQKHALDLRVFILVQPPYTRAEESLFWAERSLDFAFACGATAVTLIATRGGNGAMEAFEAMGEFAPPKLAVVEAALEYGLSLKHGRVFVDLWDIGKVPSCAACQTTRIERLRCMNVTQRILPRASCAVCGANA